MKFGALKQGDYFEKDGNLYKKLSDGMKGKQAICIKSKVTIDIPLMSDVIKVTSPPPKKIKPSKLESESEREQPAKTEFVKKKDYSSNKDKNDDSN